MNERIGLFSSVLTLFAVLGFAVSMLLGSDFGNYLSSLFIAWGLVPMIAAFAARAREEAKASGQAAIAFAAVYAALTGLVYFAQLTTVRLSPLSAQADALLNYRHLGGLLFNYDLFGYAFMALATFFIGWTVRVAGRSDRWLKLLLLGHGAFAIPCVLVPILGVFTPGMGGGDLLGLIILEIWCAYFAPVCVLSIRHFLRKDERA